MLLYIYDLINQENSWSYCIFHENRERTYLYPQGLIFVLVLRIKKSIISIIFFSNRGEIIDKVAERGESNYPHICKSAHSTQICNAHFIRRLLDVQAWEDFFEKLRPSLAIWLRLAIKVDNIIRS